VSYTIESSTIGSATAQRALRRRWPGERRAKHSLRLVARTMSHIQRFRGSEPGRRRSPGGVEPGLRCLATKTLTHSSRCGFGQGRSLHLANEADEPYLMQEVPH
jgi:hypothetical protein